jgi:hypothetical protein
MLTVTYAECSLFWMSRMFSVTYKHLILSIVMLCVIMLSVIMLSVVLLSVIVLSVIMLSVIVLSVIILSAIMPRVVAPSWELLWFLGYNMGTMLKNFLQL